MGDSKEGALNSAEVTFPSSVGDRCMHCSLCKDSKGAASLWGLGVGWGEALQFIS